MTIEDQKKRLFEAIKNDDLETVATIFHLQPQLINCKYQTAQGTTTPLIQACYRGASDTVKFLLRYQPDVCATGNLNPSRVNRSRGGYGTLDDVFPLLVATRSCQLSIVESLLKIGVRVNQTNAIGQSALHVCSMNRDHNFYDTGMPFNDTCDWIMKSLIKNGADVNLRDGNGKTPLHYACEHGNRNVVQILLKNEAEYDVKDKNGLTPLEMAAHDHYYVMSTMLEKCSFTLEETIDAYETIAFSYSCPSSFECMYKATSMRIENNVPKALLEPLECYGFTKEWETLEELEAYKEDPQDLRLQAILARERIYKDKYISQPFHWKTLKAVEEGNERQQNALLKHHFNLFRQNDDYLYFTDNFLVPYNGLFRNLATSEFDVLETETVVEIIQILMECCGRIKKKLESEVKPSTILELINEFEQDLMTAGGLISKLRKRNEEINNNLDTEDVLVKELVLELVDKFPEVLNPPTGYHVPLAHILLNTKYKTVPYFADLCVPLDFELMKLLINAGFDTDTKDNDGNTLLHTAIVSILADSTSSASHNCGYLGRSGHSSQTAETNAEKTINLLLDNGVYVYARNNAKKTILDILNDSKYQKCESLKAIKAAVKKYDQFPTLKHIAAAKLQELSFSYKDLLPRPLIRFISIH